MAFIDKTLCVEDVKSIFIKYFNNVPPIKITFDKFDAFTTHSGMHIIYLGASNIPEELLLLNNLSFPPLMSGLNICFSIFLMSSSLIIVF